MTVRVETNRMRGRPENAAAIVNGLIVLLLPIVLLVVGSYVQPHSDTSVTVRAPGSSSRPPYLFLMEAALWWFPFAALAAWRTRVHAKRWRERQVGSWRGVAEAGACGFAVALAVLARGIVTRPTEAAPYVIAYGGFALVVGLVIGLLLRMTALLVLRLLTRRQTPL